MESLLYLLLALTSHPQTLHATRVARVAHVYAPITSVNRVTVSMPTVVQAPAQTAPSQTPPTQTTPAPSVDFRSEVERLVLVDTNAFRAQNGRPALSADPALATVARSHSADMLANNYFDHSDKSGCNPGCRLINAGYTWHSYGENIHWMSGYNLSATDTAQKIVDDWINSPPHRANMLGVFTYAGTGIAVNGTTIYSTADYATK